MGASGRRGTTVRGAHCAIVTVCCWARHTIATAAGVICGAQVTILTGKRVVHKDTVAKGVVAAIVGTVPVVIADNVLADTTAAGA
jgi:hypothetical protein